VPGTKPGGVSADGSAAHDGLAAARATVAAMRMRPFMTNLLGWFYKITAKGPVSFRRATIELGQVRIGHDLWKQVFGPKKQDRAGQSC
jgi:hypothetical protein